MAKGKTVRSGEPKAEANLGSWADKVLSDVDSGQHEWQAWLKRDKHRTLLTIEVRRPDPVAMAEEKKRKAEVALMEAEAELKEEARLAAKASASVEKEPK